MLRATVVRTFYNQNKRLLDVATKPTKYKQTKIGPNFFEPEYLTFKKLVLVRLKHRTFTVPGVFDTTRLNLQETTKFKLITKQGTSRVQ